MSAHPPGPWRWDSHVLRDSTGRSILFAEEIGPRCSRETLKEALAEADAMQAAIAAAPELLAVLREVRDFWAGGDCPQDLWDKMEAAIAKAGAA